MILVPLELTDCKTISGWRNLSMDTLRTPFFITNSMQEDFYNNVISNRNSEHRYWGIYHDALIGMGGMTYIQWENSLAEISLIIDPVIRGKGYGSRAVNLLLNEGFGNMGLKTVFGECYMTQNGNVDFWKGITRKYKGYETTLPNRKFRNGKWYDSYYFSIDREGYLCTE